MGPNGKQVALEQSIAALARDLPRMTIKEACARIAWLRREATRDGFLPMAVMADGLSDALTRHGRAAPLQNWLDALSTAAGCGTGNDDTADVLLASVGVRFAA
jgi:hypothetical protein